MVTEKTLRGHARRIASTLFESNQCTWTLEDVFYFLNSLSKADSAPHSCGVLWGDALEAVLSIKRCLTILGLRGTRQQQDVKKALIGAVLNIDLLGVPLHSQRRDRHSAQCRAFADAPSRQISRTIVLT
jgi:hypothetical protein